MSDNEVKKKGLSWFHRGIDFLIKYPTVTRFTPQFLINRIFEDKTIDQEKLRKVLAQLGDYRTNIILKRV